MKHNTSAKINWKVLGALFWLFFTLAMAAWWLVTGLEVLNKLGEQVSDLQGFVNKHKNMLIWEGTAWMFLLLGGGLTLVFFILKEQRQKKTLKQFLATFSHDVKTALASLKLQSEILAENMGEITEIKRIATDVARLQLQLDNSMYLSSEDNLTFHLEEIELKPFIKSLSGGWPQLKFSFKGDGKIFADKRSISGIFNNIFHNSQIHGRAEKVEILIEQNIDFIKIIVKDNGKGFSGNKDLLGKLFVRHNPSSGSGIGLYSVRELMKKFNGRAIFGSPSQSGFVVELIFDKVQR